MSTIARRPKALANERERTDARQPTSSNGVDDVAAQLARMNEHDAIAIRKFGALAPQGPLVPGWSQAGLPGWGSQAGGPSPAKPWAVTSRHPLVPLPYISM